MANATIIRAWQDGVNANIVVVVSEGGGKGNVEYSASVLLSEINALGSNAAKKAALVAAVKAVRDAALPPAPVDLSAVANGSVTI